MNIGILTGGGHVPGLNACLKAIVTRALSEGHTVTGIRRGWAGLLYHTPDDDLSFERWFLPLTPETIQPLDQPGGTLLHSSRIDPSRIAGDSPDSQDLTAQVVANIAHLGLDVLIPIGGDDILNYANRLSREGVPVVAIPKTNDNDVYGTDYTLGFSTAITNSIHFIYNLRPSIRAQERIGIIELFGKFNGHTCLFTAHLAGVDRTLIPEVPYDVDKLAQLILDDQRQNPYNYALIAIAEGAEMLGGRYRHQDSFSTGAQLAVALQTLTGQEAIFQQVAHLIHSGRPDATDLMVAYNYANLALDLIQAENYGRLVALQAGKYADVPLSILSEGVKRVDVDAFYNTHTYRPQVQNIHNCPMFLY